MGKDKPLERREELSDTSLARIVKSEGVGGQSEPTRDDPGQYRGPFMLGKTLVVDYLDVIEYK